MANRNDSRDRAAGVGEAGTADLDALFRCLASRKRRAVLGALYDRAPHALTHRDLATSLDSGYHEDASERATDEVVRRTAADLRHVHLPKLDAAGMIDRDPDRGTAMIADHPAFEDEGILAVIAGETDADHDSLDALFGALGDARRRTTLDVLSHQFGPIHRETLARELGAIELDVVESDVPSERVDEILASLHHVHLPHLSEADLIDYDDGDRTVAYAGHPDLRVPWIHSVLEPDFRPSLTGDSDPDGLGEIQGREGIVSFGQSLCERADEELFCLFTTTNLLEAGCFTRIRDASRRGVTVYLGTPDPTVREYIQEHAPDVVLWEPEIDWLNLPATGGRIGRLLLADRKAVMLGTLMEGTADDGPEERAIVGDGADDTLVTMVRQLVTPHLQQFDDVDASTELPPL